MVVFTRNREKWCTEICSLIHLNKKETMHHRYEKVNGKYNEDSNIKSTKKMCRETFWAATWHNPKNSIMEIIYMLSCAHLN